MKKKVSVFLIAIFLFSSLFSDVLASENNGFEEKISVNPIIPDNQTGPNLGYFNLRVHPNLNQKLELEVENKTSDDIEFKVEANGAGTNANGLIDYQLFTDEQGIREFNKVLKVTEPFVKLGPGEKKIVKFEISLPDKEFDGILLGAVSINFSEREHKKNSINNNISYTIGVVLSENDTHVEPILDFLSVDLEEKNNRMYVESKLGNTTPTIIENVKIRSVLRKGNKEIIIKDMDSIRIAPKSTFNYRMDVSGNENLEAGLYEIDIVATSNNYTWKWTENLLISEKQIEQIGPISIKKAQLQQKLVILISVLSLIVGILSVKVFLKRKNGNDN